MDTGSPEMRLQKFVRLLGWRSPLRMHQQRVDEEEAPATLRGDVITWYECGVASGGRSDFFLQVNESPQSKTLAYSGAVYAIRYRICTGWHEFRLFRSDTDLEREANRLAPWLAREWFATIEKRRAFRKAHPEYVAKSQYRRATLKIQVGHVKPTF